jgi:hypothetical protein
MNKLVLLPLFLLCLLLPSQALATEFIPYWGDDTIMYSLPKDPKICILNNNGGDSGFKMTQSVLNSWANKLNHLTFSNNWNMSLVSIYKMHMTDCNVTFNYSLEPHPYQDINVPDGGGVMIGTPLATTTCDNQTYGHEYCEIKVFMLNVRPSNIYATVQHEFGHAMGLGHTQGDTDKDKRKAFLSDDLMYAVAKPWSHLTNDDALAVIHLYGVHGFHTVDKTPDNFIIDHPLMMKQYCNGVNGTVCLKPVIGS